MQNYRLPMQLIACIYTNIYQSEQGMTYIYVTIQVVTLASYKTWNQNETEWNETKRNH